MQAHGADPSRPSGPLAAVAVAPLRALTGDGHAVNPETLVEAQRRSGLSDAELARIFHVRAACLTNWRRHGVPRADAHRLGLLSELIDALEACGASSPRLTETLRRPLPQPGRPSLLDLLARRDTRGITTYLRALDPALSLSGRLLGA